MTGSNRKAEDRIRTLDDVDLVISSDSRTVDDYLQAIRVTKRYLDESTRSRASSYRYQAAQLAFDAATDHGSSTQLCETVLEIAGSYLSQADQIDRLESSTASAIAAVDRLDLQPLTPIMFRAAARKRDRVRELLRELPDLLHSYEYNSRAFLPSRLRRIFHCPHLALVTADSLILERPRPVDGRVFNTRAAALLDLGRLDEALEASIAVDKAFPSNNYTLNVLSRALRLSGDHAEALRAAKDSLHLVLAEHRDSPSDHTRSGIKFALHTILPAARDAQDQTAFDDASELLMEHSSERSTYPRLMAVENALYDAEQRDDAEQVRQAMAEMDLLKQSSDLSSREKAELISVKKRARYFLGRSG